LNLPQSVAIVLSKRMATMVELDTVLGVHDLHDLLEVIAVDSSNEYTAQKANQE